MIKTEVSECGNFWFWYTRPFAEILAGLTIIGVVMIIYMALIFFLEWKNNRKTK